MPEDISPFTGTGAAPVSRTMTQSSALAIDEPKATHTKVRRASAKIKQMAKEAIEDDDAGRTETFPA